MKTRGQEALVKEEEWMGTLLGTNLAFIQRKGGYRFSVDALLLTTFLLPIEERSIIDLGTGEGVIPLLLTHLHPVEMSMVGLELQEGLSDVAKRNVSLNHRDSEIRILQGDLREAWQMWPRGSFDLVLSNPPFRKLGEWRLSLSLERAMAFHEVGCTLEELIEVCLYLVSPGGRIALIYLPERLKETQARLERGGFGHIKAKFVHSKAVKRVMRVLLEARKALQPCFTLLPPLILCEEDGSDSPEAKRIYNLFES